MPATTSVPNLIATQIVKGLRYSLSMNSSQVFVSAIPVLDIGWQGQIQIQVVIGDEKAYGGGKGGQEGGELLRSLDINLVVFYRMNLDVHGESSYLLTQTGKGLNDLLENIRQVFQLTYLGTSNGLSNSEYVLFEPMYFKTKTKPVWEDEELGIMTSTITYECNFGSYPFSGISLTPQQIESV